MDHQKTAAFFADFCEVNPMAAHELMMNMLHHPTSGVTVHLPRLINTKDFNRFYRETEEVARKFIMKPEANA